MNKYLIVVNAVVITVVVCAVVIIFKMFTSGIDTMKLCMTDAEKCPSSTTHSSE